MSKGGFVPKPRPPQSEAEIDRFIDAADDAQARAAAETRKPISVTVLPSILTEFDKAAKARGLTRAAALGMAMQDWTEAERKRKE